MWHAPGMAMTSTRARGPTSRRAEAPAVPRARARWWLLMSLIGLMTALEVGLIVAVGAKLRSTAAGAPRMGRSDAGRGPRPETSTATLTAAADPREPVTDPGRLSRCVVDPLAPRPRQDRGHSPSPGPAETDPPVAGAAERRSRHSVLADEPRPVVVVPAEGAADPPARDVRSLGAELFARSWLPDDPRCHGGDGLGPVYNASSCL